MITTIIIILSAFIAAVLALFMIGKLISEISGHNSIGIIIAMSIIGFAIFYYINL